jgi:hypothetical protein
MRNNTNYMETCVLASLEMIAHNGQMFLENFYKKGINSLVAAIETPPYAFVIPKEQTDPKGANGAFWMSCGNTGLNFRYRKNPGTMEKPLLKKGM